MRIIALFITLFFVQISIAQIPDWEWVRTMDCHFNSWKRSVTVDNNGDAIVVIDFVGSSITFGDITLINDNPSHYYAEIAIVKYDNQGNVLWARNYGGPKRDSPTALTTDSTGNIYITGQFEEAITFGSFTLTTTTGQAGFIAKFDSNGNPVFAKKIIEETSISPFHAIKTDNAGNVYLTGSFNSATATFGMISFENEGWSPNIATAQRPFVAKMDSMGNYIWVRVAKSTNNMTSGATALSLDIDAAGNVYSGGNFSCATLMFGNQLLTKTTAALSDNNMYLVKYDANGTEIWARNAGSNLENNGARLWAVKVDLEQNIYASGFFSGNIIFQDTTLNAVGANQLFTVKYDANGNVLWTKIPVNEPGVNQGHSLAIDENNDLYVAGTFTNNPQIDFGNGVVLTNPDLTDGALFIAKFTPEGEAVWGKSIAPFNGICIVDLYCKSQNELYISSSYAYPITFGNHTIEKLDGTYDQFLTKLSYDALRTTDWNQNKNKVYPNPVQDKLVISQPENFKTYALYNLLGAKVTEGIIRPETGTIDFSSVSKGIYILHLLHPESGSETIKLIKE